MWLNSYMVYDHVYTFHSYKGGVYLIIQYGLLYLLIVKAIVKYCTFKYYNGIKT
jgi:hypothetical protein